MEVDTIEWNGKTYRRYPQAKQRTHRVYYSRSRDKSGKTGFLHREIWESHWGKIPKGFHIHHKDNNPLNNDIKNLQLVTPKEHALLDRNWEKWDYQSHLEEIRPMTKEWHASEEGKKWHEDHAKNIWENWEYTEKECVVCGKKYKAAQKNRSKYCHPNCKATALRRRRGIPKRK